MNAHPNKATFDGGEPLVVVIMIPQGTLALGAPFYGSEPPAGVNVSFVLATFFVGGSAQEGTSLKTSLPFGLM